MQVLKFPQVSTYDDYWKHLDKFIQGETRQKKRLGFMLHDLNGDGRICPNDVFDLTLNINDYDLLLSLDYYFLSNSL
jgi:hypothetical protein